MFKIISLLTSLSAIASPILDDFKSQGYHEMLNEQCGQEYFAKVYSQLDALIDFIDKNPQWARFLYDIDLEYVNSPENRLYGSPPVGYIDNTKSGKSKKNYFHFTERYLNFITNKHPEILSDSEEFKHLLKSLKEICKISEKKFAEAIESIAHKIDLSKTLYTENGELLTLVKVVRYEPSDLAASHPHFDFSGLSFLFDNSENNECESLLIAPYKENLKSEDFSTPSRQHKKNGSTSSLLLIPGLALQQLDVPINPTPHGVQKQTKQRYAIIVFAMAPNTKLSYDEIRIQQIKLPDL